MEPKRINVTVNIEGVTLPMTASSTEEERIYRKAATLIQDRLRNMRERYPSLPSDTYYYAMVMFNTAVDALRSEGNADSGPFMEMMTDLNTEIDEVLNSKQEIYQ